MTAGLSVVSIGPVAAEILTHDGDADVAAVFDRSCYVMTTHGYVAIGGETLGQGPLNVLLLANLGPLDWIRLGITREAKGSVSNGRLSIGQDFVVGVRAAVVWQPAAWPKASRATVTSSLAMIREHGAPLTPSEGLSRLVLAPGATLDRTARAAAPRRSVDRGHLVATGWLLHHRGKSSRRYRRRR